MRTNGFVQLVACHSEFMRPVSDIGSDFWVDFVWVVGPFGRFFVKGVGLVGLRCVMMLSHRISLSVPILDDCGGGIDASLPRQAT